MANVVKTTWIHPPNWDGEIPDSGGWKNVIVNLSMLSDSTNESDVTKVNISELRMPNGQVPTMVTVKKITGHASGLNVLLEWDRAPHIEITRILGNGGVAHVDIADYMVDPSDGTDGTDGTGNILLTTTEATSGDGYDLTLHLILKN